jgi:hypothetical protein
VTPDNAHHQPAAGAGVAEIERFAWRRERAEARPTNSPCARRETLDDGAELLASLAGPENIVALEQPFHLRLATGQKAKQKSAMGDRFVARRPDPTFKRS